MQWSATADKPMFMRVSLRRYLAAIAFDVSIETSAKAITARAVLDEGIEVSNATRQEQQDQQEEIEQRLPRSRHIHRC